MIYNGMDKEVSTGTENNAHLASLNFLPRLRSYRDVKRPFFSHNLISCSRFLDSESLLLFSEVELLMNTWSVGRDVCHNLNKWAESYTSILLSEHLF